MKKLFILCALFTLLLFYSFTFSSCRMAPKDNPGDTVAASVFAPIDTATLNLKARLAKKNAPVKDSVDIFYVGEGSTSNQLQLLSYPSRRDTLLYSKARHMRKTGNADFGHIVRISLWISPANDTLVQKVEEILPEELAAEAAANKAITK